MQWTLRRQQQFMSEWTKENDFEEMHISLGRRIACMQFNVEQHPKIMNFLPLPQIKNETLTRRIVNDKLLHASSYFMFLPIFSVVIFHFFSVLGFFHFVINSFFVRHNTSWWYKLCRDEAYEILQQTRKKCSNMSVCVCVAATKGVTLAGLPFQQCNRLSDFDSHSLCLCVFCMQTNRHCGATPWCKKMRQLCIQFSAFTLV